MLLRPPRSTLFPTRRSSDLGVLRWRQSAAGAVLSQPGRPRETIRYPCGRCPTAAVRYEGWSARSEEHTSELQSHVNLVCRLLLEKKNTETTIKQCITQNTRE